MTLRKDALSSFYMVTIGSVFSLINAIFRMNFFVLASWIAVIGIVFKFLRKEYVSTYGCNYR